MEDRRSYFRFSTKLKALYYFEGEKEKLEKCNLLNVGYKGLGVNFKPHEKIKAGTSIHLGIIIKRQLIPISVRGVLKWVKEEANDSVAGIELTEELDDITMIKLF